MKKFTFTCIVGLLSLCIHFVSEGQSLTVSGNVSLSDEPGGTPGIAVQVEGTPRGAYTDINGVYRINLEANDSILVFSYLGYTKQRIRVDGRTTIDVVLQQEAITNKEVVVVGYGTQRKSDITGSISSIKSEDLIKVPNNNPVQALQGKAAGVQVVSSSGAPGDGVKVRIRGIGSIGSGSDPLYVVDGVFMSDISAINSQDIVSMEILKDASSAAIFGVRGSNGVVLVTTKQGKEGKPAFSFSTEYGIQNVNKKIDLLNGKQFAELYNELPGLEGTYNADNVPNTDWQSLIFRKNARIQNHQFSASGGSPNSSYYFGLGYFKQEGVIPNSNYERISIRTNGSYNLTKFWKLGSNLTLAPSNQRNAPGGVVATAYRAYPIILPNRQGTDSTAPYNEVPTYGNPLADLEYNSNNYTKNLAAVANVYTEVSLPYGFKYRFNFGIDLNYGRNVNFVPKYFVGPVQNTPYNQMSTYRDWKSNTLVDNMLYFNREFGKHSIDAFAAVSVYRNFSERLTASAINLARTDEDLWYIGSNQVLAQGAGSSQSLFTNASTFGRINYNYDGRYLLTVTGRRDGSSLFGKENRFGFFPSVALGWMVTEESFMKKVPVINSLKLKASVGKLGNSRVGGVPKAGDYGIVDNSVFSTPYNVISSSAPAVFGTGNTFLTGSAPGKTANPALHWEETRQIDIGGEIGILNNRLTIEADYYNRNTNDILVELQTPGYFGNGANVKVLYNAANVVNSGFEYNVTWRDKIGEVGYRIGTLGTTIKNNVVDLGNTVQSDEFISGGSISGSFVARTQAGQPIGSFYGYKVLGIFQDDAELAAYPNLSGSKPGDFKYADINNDGKINDKDRTFLGSAIPKFIFGFNLGVNYAGFDLSADFQGQTGNKIYNGKAVIRPGIANYEAKYADRWRANAPSTSIPRATAGGNNFLPSEFFLEDGTFMRLRTLTLSYTLPKDLVKKVFMGSASIFARGTNLLTWTKFSGYTPEVGSADIDGALDLGIYPVATVYTCGANITF